MTAVPTTARALRDLGEQEFAARYHCDRFTATVLSNRFVYIVEHMCSRLLTAAFSPILRDFYDFAATIAGPPSIRWPTPAMSASIVLFTGTMADSVRNTVEEYGIDRRTAWGLYAKVRAERGSPSRVATKEAIARLGRIRFI